VKLVDSDILMAHLRGVKAAQDWLKDARRETGPLAISAITVTEVAGGMRSPERREVNRLLATMRRFAVTEPIAWRAAGFMRTYQRSHQGIGLGDYLIAGTADVEGLDLATLNVRQFPMFPDLEKPFET
jgi:predicted nucleic acid-binding protein